MRRLFSLLLGVAFCAQNAVAGGNFKLGGFTEALVSVSEIQPLRDAMLEAGGWEVRHEGPLSRAQLGAWQLPASISGKEVLLANKGMDRGFMRLVQLRGAQARHIRSNDQSWDSGGIFDLNLRVASMESSFRELQARHWQASSDPVGFSFGPFQVEEWLARGPDGVRFALIERIAPTLEGWPQLKQFSRVFNSTQVVADIEPSLHFYRDILGMQVYMEHRGASSKAGPNVLGLPHNLSTEIPRVVYILHPQKLNEGSIEILAYEGATGRDFSEGAWFPNLGIAGLRLPVEGLQALHGHLQAEGVPIASPPRELEIFPYGKCLGFTAIAPNGSHLEFYEVITPR